MLYVVIGILVLLIVYILITYNVFIKYKNRVNEAFSTMDVYLKKRWDLIPNLVETVKAYSKHEKETITDIIKIRSYTYDNMSDNQKIETNQQLSNKIPTLMALAETYPDLKASDNYKDLSDKLTKVEDDIASSRKYYNGTVREYNNKVEMFPNNLIAKLFGYKTQKMFEANPNEKESIKVDL